jgi:restriction system protein
MPIPDYQTLMLPVLRLTEDGNEYPVAGIRSQIANVFNLTPEDLSQKLKSGTTLLANRVGWAIAYLSKAQLLTLTARGVYRITERGATFLKANPPAITARSLRQFPEFADFQSRGDSRDGEPQPAPPPDDNDRATPEERLETSFQTLRDALARELLQVLLSGTPMAFEKVVVDLIVAMGYGGSLEDAGSVVGKSGDGGIDGVIKQDKLGLDVVYVQAKRWKDVVGSPEIMKFSGSLTKRHASKGVFITTSYFSKDALEYVEAISQKIVLIDGRKLATFMIDHNVGVAPAKSYVVKRLDQDYFESL